MAKIPFLGKRGAAAPSAQQATMVPLDQVLQILEAQNRANSSQGENTPLPMESPDLWWQIPFGPGARIFPAGITQLRPDTDRTEPQVFEYPVAWNLRITQERLIPWKTLRTAATGPVIRPIITKRQKDLTKLNWDITVKRSVIEETARATGDGSHNAASKLTKTFGPDIARLRQFWESPDRDAGLDFADWFIQLIEEQLTHDAVAVYPETTYGGDLYGLRVIDGTTIKPLLNEYGRRPQPPYPAFQQMLYGFPRGEWTADVGIHDPGVYVADQLVYRRKVVRTFSPYGLSPTEEALLDLDLFLKRHGWMRAEYTEGTLAEAYLKTSSGTTGGQATIWSAQKLLEYERQLNDQQSGSSAERHRMRMLPPGWEPVSFNDASERYKADYDLYAIQLVCSHFGERAEELGFTVGKGALGGTGIAKQSGEVSAESGLFPDARWWQGVFTSISHKYLGMPPELQFRFMDIEEEDLGSQDQMAQNRVESGRMTYNEERDRLGLPRYEDPLADIPVIVTRKGLQPLTMEGLEIANGLEAGAYQGGTQTANQKNPEAVAPAGKGRANEITPPKPVAAKKVKAPKTSNSGSATQAGASTKQTGTSEPARAKMLKNQARTRDTTQAPGDRQKSVTLDERELALSEIRAYKNWVTKRATSRTRPFSFASEAELVQALNPELDLSAAVFKGTGAQASADTDAYARLAKDFPPEAIYWAKRAKWSAPDRVGLGKVDVHDQSDWAASHDPDKVARFQKKLQEGKPQKPIVVVRKANQARVTIIDGHHHFLAAAKENKNPVAFVGIVSDEDYDKAIQTHTQQFTDEEKAEVAQRAR